MVVLFLFHHPLDLLNLFIIIPSKAELNWFVMLEILRGGKLKFSMNCTFQDIEINLLIRMRQNIFFPFSLSHCAKRLHPKCLKENSFLNLIFILKAFLEEILAFFWHLRLWPYKKASQVFDDLFWQSSTFNQSEIFVKKIELLQSDLCIKWTPFK